MLKLSLIVAMDRNGVIGRGNAMPWHLSTDLKNFRKVTMGKPVIMGRRTHESIGKVLPGRRNIILTRNTSFHAEGCDVCHDLDAALALCAGEEEALVIGGREIYALAIDYAQRIYLTEVQAEVEGDVHFIDFDRSLWEDIQYEEYPAGLGDDYPFTYTVYEKIRPLYW